MSQRILSLLQYIVTVLAPAADRYDTTFETRKVDMSKVDHVCFLVSEGAGGVGTAKFEVYAYDKDGANGESIKFKYRVTAAGSFETFGAVQSVAAGAGYTSVAGATKQIAIEVQSLGLPDGKPLVTIKGTEVVNSPCSAGIVAICAGARFGVDDATTITTA